MLHHFKKIGIAVSVALTMGASFAAHASYPDKPVTLIVNYPAGGILDTLGRIIAEYASEKTGQPVVVENKPGAAGLIGGQFVARQKPDGYNLLLSLDTLYTVNPFAYNKMSFDPQKDLIPISLVGSVNQVLLANKKLETKNYEDFLDQAATQDLTYSSAGLATPGHVTMELFKRDADVDLLHVPYKGNAPATYALYSGEVDAGFLALGAAFQYVQSGDFIPLAISSTERDPRMPEVPTLQEVGGEKLKNFDVEFGHVLMAPKGTDPEIINFWSDMIAEAINDPEIKIRFSNLNVSPTYGSPSETKAYLDNVASQWKEVVKDANISLD